MELWKVNSYGYDQVIEFAKKRFIPGIAEVVLVELVTPEDVVPILATCYRLDDDQLGGDIGVASAAYVTEIEGLKPVHLRLEGHSHYWIEDKQSREMFEVGFSRHLYTFPERVAVIERRGDNDQLNYQYRIIVCDSRLCLADVSSTTTGAQGEAPPFPIFDQSLFNN